MRFRSGLALFCTLAAVAGLPGCHSVDVKNSVVSDPVYIPFTGVGDWELYGVSGAMQSRAFVKWLDIPADYPYQEYCFTGFGGVLMTCTAMSNYCAFDMACPVEHSQNVRVEIDPDMNMAVCPKCGSVYDVFQMQEPPGYPVAGPAREDGYGLTVYRVVFGVDGRYALITR